ncbi:MAG: glycosyltransferase family 2 protein [Alphaproteobacteria bacterium]|uniref:Glycosyltransferase family 2 protein n=1 Tax=Candidatus Nitrobium versatile TaxID=2884831 RepID=A0A953J9E0_9BACT|nr:glycosyltransferase family 2 protein [Candidatus Nitrobium versatile]
MLCWAYNEEDSIGEYLERATEMIDSAVEDYEIVLIDDCSTDRTNEIARAFQEKNPRLKIFRNEKNLNVGISSRRAIQRASKEFLFWQTIDWSYDIANLRQYLECLRFYDIVQGVRRKPVAVKIRFLRPFVALARMLGMKHLTRRSDTVQKALVSIINYLLIRLLFNVPLSDFQNVTFYPTKWIQSVQYEAKSSFANPEGLIKSYWNGMSIKEVPISFIPRSQGTAKGTRIKAITASVKDIFRLWFSWVVLGKRGSIKKGKIHRLNPAEWEETA